MIEGIKSVYRAMFASKSAPAPVPAIQGRPPKGEVAWADSVLYAVGDFAKYNPDQLIARKGPEIYAKMMLDEQVKAVLRFKQKAVVSRGWYFDVAQDDKGNPDPDQQAQADFFTVVIERCRGSWTDHLTKILSAMPHGYSIVEKVFAPIDYEGRTMWGLEDLKLRPFATFEFKVDEYGNITELTQKTGGRMLPVPMDKVIHFVHDPDVDPHYGQSDLRACYRAWWSKDVAIKFHNIFLERLASGFIWAKKTGYVSPENHTKLEQLLKNISARMGAVLPENVDLNSMQPHNSVAHERAIAMHDKSIAKGLLVPNLLGLAEQGDTGSYSQSETQFKVFLWILTEISNRLAETLNEQLFSELARWNFGTATFPRFCFEAMSEEEKAAIATRWNELVKGGSVQRTDADEAWIRQQVGAPEKSEETAPDDLPDTDATPVETPANDEWIEDQPEEKQDGLRAEFASKPWLKRVNFARMEERLEASDTQLIDDLNAAMAEIKLALQKQITKTVGERSLGNVAAKEFEALAIPKGVLTRARKALRAGLQQVLDDGYAAAAAELPKKQFARIGPGMDLTQAERFLASKVLRIAGVLDADVLAQVRQVLENAITYDRNLSDTIGAIESDTKLVQLLPETDGAGRPINIPVRLENIARTNTADALNRARMALFGSPDLQGFVRAYEYSAVLDGRTSEICNHLHGKVLRDFGEYTPPNHHFCRSVLVPVTVIDDWDGVESARPTMRPQKGFF